MSTNQSKNVKKGSKKKKKKAATTKMTGLKFIIPSASTDQLFKEEEDSLPFRN